MTPEATALETASLQVEEGPQGVTLRIQGRLDARTTGGVWRQAQAAFKRPADMIVDASGVGYCDLSGIGLLVDLRERQKAAGRSFRIEGLAEDSRRLLEMFDKDEAVPEAVPRRVPLPETVGRATMEVLNNLRELVTFVGELVANLGRVVVHRQKVRWGDTLLVAESAGVHAIPIITLMGLMLGLILAFQGAVPLRRYGAEILVADMVVIAMFREMGPLFTAIMLAARSASAFAAELGTMKVNEEVDALKTMGLSPVSFLAVPRVLAGVFVTPILTVYMNLWGLVGGWAVFVGLGFQTQVYVDRIILRGSAGDLLSGLFRSLIFGIIVAGVGCMEGLRTGTGARAVGESTTRSVVTAIILIILADGLISVMFFSLGI
jgi:phospholipid/cholesterol/gamma-HCH transport system permease protein